jgi:hypothetical protein
MANKSTNNCDTCDSTQNKESVAQKQNATQNKNAKCADDKCVDSNSKCKNKDA